MSRRQKSKELDGELLFGGISPPPPEALKKKRFLADPEIPPGISARDRKKVQRLIDNWEWYVGAPGSETVVLNREVDITGPTTISDVFTTRMTW